VGLAFLSKQQRQDQQVQQKFPVLLFSPLWNSGRSPYAFLYEMLASHGFIVAAVEHVPDYDRDADDFETLEQMHELDTRATPPANFFAHADANFDVTVEAYAIAGY
jgi:predicted dienelactone hydrolase